jgi:hypothetical protein
MRIQNLPEKCALAAHQPERHRQIKRGAFLANVGWSEVDGHGLSSRKIEAAVSKRRFDALAAFLDGNIGKACDGEITWAAWADVHLDFDEGSINAEHRGAECLEKHSKK